LIQMILGNNLEIPLRLDDPNHHSALFEPTSNVVRFKDSTTKKQGTVFPDGLVTADIKNLQSYSLYQKAVTLGKLGFMD
ncbi:hypothetical protein, partial [Salmonella enterica]|uniref:hypothetical protein n=1 Tax=Salmonella enterica TaxID=28901 RepID=UPI0020C591D7